MMYIDNIDRKCKGQVLKKKDKIEEHNESRGIIAEN